MNPKIVIWGHPLHSHTHSYIHYGFYKAFLSLGYDVQWVDDIEDNGIDLNDSIVISERQVIKHLPITKNAKYLIHNYCLDFEDTGYNNVHNFLVYHKRYSWNNVERVNSHCWYDSKTKTPVIMWATDLLPQEIDQHTETLYDPNKKDVYFVGSVQGKNLYDFAHICANNGKNFINLGGYTGDTDDENGTRFYDNQKSINAVKESYISFDIREDQHLDNGYVPCRIFKNISYGKFTGTNSESLTEFFGDRISVNKNLHQLYFDIEEKYKKCDKNRLRDDMEFIKKSHTYINRVEFLLSIL